MRTREFAGGAPHHAQRPEGALLLAVFAVLPRRWAAPHALRTRLAGEPLTRLRTRNGRARTGVSDIRSASAWRNVIRKGISISTHELCLAFLFQSEFQQL